GLPNVPDILENLVREIEEEEQSGKVGEERFRLLLLGGIPTYKTDLFNWLERDMGANIVMSELTDVTWDEMDQQDPYRDLARKIILHPVSGTNRRRVEWALKMARDYSIDGAVHISHWGCRQTSGGVGVLREGLETIGIPLMNLDIDLVDPRSYSSGQAYTRIQAFIEMLSQRRGEET
ncbi:MAG: 2-hydroxyacyl-CoA dehydratase family protein, partial [Thermodesulfobacteriota bacterium]|nr:2-hydroxyacyl-CoA dehydratase family protein [Thermodesulfobacteriota bacterium]